MKHSASRILSTKVSARPPSKPRGFALIIVLFVLAVMAASVGSYFATTTSSARASSAMVDRRRAFYMCDGLSRIIAQVAQQYIVETPGANALGMKPYVCDKGGSVGCTQPALLPNFVDAGFVMHAFELDPMAAAPSPGLITEGPLSGMQADQMPIRVYLEIERTASGATCELDQEIMLGSVSMFQFFLFAEDDVSWVPGPASMVRGPVHVNGDLCVGGGTGLGFERIQATGSIFNHASASDCKVAAGDKVCIWNGTGILPTLAGMASFPPTNCPVLTTANDSGAGWNAATWGNRALDGSNQVKPLKLPVAATALVQSSVESNNTTTYSNNDSSRLLVDPVRAADTNEVRAQKFACKADIRIINGVWYRRDDANPTTDPCGGWPGTPIWSDHPGAMNLSAANEPNERSLVGNVDIGQEDIGGAQNWSGIPSGVNAIQTPRRYSPYRFSRIAGQKGLMVPDGTVVPVVTYGAIQNDGAGNFRNAHWIDDDDDPEDVCGDTSVGSTATLVPITAATVGPGSECEAGFDAAYLNASRGGFVDPQVLRDGDSPGSQAQQESRSRILPLNIDVAALRAALTDCAIGELGSYFPGTCSGFGRRFNGIIYVTNTWSNSLDGFGNPAPIAGGANYWVPQGGNNDGSQPEVAASVASTANKPQLPYPLCAKAADNIGNDMVDNSGSPDEPFKVTGCNAYNSENGARPQAVRIINAQIIGDDTNANDPLPKGLTIATNVPIYVAGDVNTASDTSSAVASPWVPFLVAGDSVRLFSRNWTDAWVPWGNAGAADHDGGGSPARPAVATTYNMQILSGQPVTSTGAYSGGIENFPAFFENWNNVNATITGAFVRGFSPVYMRWRQQGYKRAPDRPWTFDPHLASVGSQPPGAPRYDVQAVRIWKRN